MNLKKKISESHGNRVPVYHYRPGCRGLYAGAQACRALKEGWKWCWCLAATRMTDVHCRPEHRAFGCGILKALCQGALGFPAGHPGRPMMSPELAVTGKKASEKYNDAAPAGRRLQHHESRDRELFKGNHGKTAPASPPAPLWESVAGKEEFAKTTRLPRVCQLCPGRHRRRVHNDEELDDITWGLMYS